MGLSLGLTAVMLCQNRHGRKESPNKSLQRAGGRWYLACESLAVGGLQSWPRGCIQMLPLESSLPRFSISRIWIVIACIPLVLVMYKVFGSSDATFWSFDSNWAGHEISFRAVDFENVDQVAERGR